MSTTLSTQRRVPVSTSVSYVICPGISPMSNGVLSSVHPSSVGLSPPSWVSVSVLPKVYAHLRSRKDIKSVSDDNIIKAITNCFVIEAEEKCVRKVILGLASSSTIDINLDVCDLFGDKLVESIHSGIEGVDYLTFFSPVSNGVKSVVDRHMEENGYVFDTYYSYVKSDHPLYAAWSGQMRLTPATFEFGVTDAQVMKKDDLLSKGSGYRDVWNSIVSSSRGRVCTWTRDSLRRAIVTSGLVCGGKANLVNNVKMGRPTIPNRTGKWLEISKTLRSVLTLDLLTGIHGHNAIPLPGFGIEFYEPEDDINRQLDVYHTAMRDVYSSLRTLWRLGARFEQPDHYDMMPKFVKKNRIEFGWWDHSSLPVAYYLTVYRILFSTRSKCTIAHVSAAGEDYNALMLSSERSKLKICHPPKMDIPSLLSQIITGPDKPLRRMTTGTRGTAPITMCQNFIGCMLTAEPSRIRTLEHKFSSSHHVRFLLQVAIDGVFGTNPKVLVYLAGLMDVKPCIIRYLEAHPDKCWIDAARKVIKRYIDITLSASAPKFR
jgi:hypothetical protein